jgi:hypothetical protein
LELVELHAPNAIGRSPVLNCVMVCTENLAAVPGVSAATVDFRKRLR